MQDLAVSKDGGPNINLKTIIILSRDSWCQRLSCLPVAASAERSNAHVKAAINGEPQYRPQNTTTLITGTNETGYLIFHNSLCACNIHVYASTHFASRQACEGMVSGLGIGL